MMTAKGSCSLDFYRDRLETSISFFIMYVGQDKGDECRIINRAKYVLLYAASTVAKQATILEPFHGIM